MGRFRVRNSVLLTDWMQSNTKAARASMAAWAKALVVSPTEVCDRRLVREDGEELFVAKVPDTSAAVGYLVDDGQRVITIVKVVPEVVGLIARAIYEIKNSSD